MKTNIWVRALFGVVMLVAAVSVRAQTTAGSGTVVVIPLVTHSSSFKAEIFVRNPQSIAITLNVRFYDTLLLPPPGQRPCTQFVVPAGRTASFTLDTQCTFNPANSHFGMLVLEDATGTYKTNYFFAFARSQSPGGVGASVEGFPVGNFSGMDADVIGLKRVAAAPGFQSNCFVSALGEAVNNYSVTLFDGTTNVQLGSPITGPPLVAYQTVRFSDVFAVASAAGGDHLNARARFSTTDPNAPSLVGFCTVQENNTFGADFRIAKSRDGLDRRQKRTVCYSSSDCINADTGTSGTQIPDTTHRNVHYLFIAQPDFVKCDLVSAHNSDLEMRLRVADDSTFGNATFVPTAPYNGAPYTPGGTGLQGFYVFTGHRSQVGQGTGVGQITRWYIDVQPSATGVANSADFPLFYGIICHSGNGVSVPWFRGQALSSGFP